MLLSQRRKTLQSEGLISLTGSSATLEYHANAWCDPSWMLYISYGCMRLAVSKNDLLSENLVLSSPLVARWFFWG